MSLLQRAQFYLVYALRSLRREGFRTILAGLSITFGVLSLVSMQELSSTLLSGSMFNERLQYGGDGEILTDDWTRPFTTAELDQIEAWHNEGLIAQYTLTSQGSAQYLRTTRSGRVTFLSQALGIDPTTYPLVGDLTLREPANARAVDVLRAPTDAILTRDLADSLGVHIGDTLLLGGGDVAPFKMTIAGIASATPNVRGSSIFYNLDAARLIENRKDAITTASVLWGDAPNASQIVIDSPFNVRVARTSDEVAESSVQVSVFDLMLKGAGVLGLLVGGLGVSNTLQVMLARRKLEIAMLKTLGCRRHTLLLMMGLEMGLLALISSVIGAAAGAALSGILLNVLGGVGTFMLNWTPNTAVLIGGVMAGTSTAIVFGMQAILASSSTRPIQLLRDMPTKTPVSVLAGRAALFGILVLIFGGLVGLVLGSIVLGVACVVLGGVLLIALRTLFWVVLWGVLKLPLPRLPLVRLARANLRHRKTQSSLIIMALFAGVFSVTFAALSIHTAAVTVDGQRASDEGYNIAVYTTSDQAAAVRDTVNAQTPLAVYTRYLTDGQLNGASTTIEGRGMGELGNDVVFDGLWEALPETALLPDSQRGVYTVGDRIILEGQSQITVEIVGFYTSPETFDYMMGGPAEGVIADPQTAIALGGERTQVIVMASFPAEGLATITDTLGMALPEALVFSKADLNDLLVSTFHSLFTFAISIAGLAFVAGAILIANSAGLTIVERRREIGVFKTVGYTSGHVLRLLVSEYSFLGLLGGIFGLIAVVIVIVAIQIAQPAAKIIIEPRIIALMLILSIGIATLSAVAVVWQSARVRPLTVLRYE